jgi:hypothetical protein
VGECGTRGSDVEGRLREPRGRLIQPWSVPQIPGGLGDGVTCPRSFLVSCRPPMVGLHPTAGASPGRCRLSRPRRPTETPRCRAELGDQFPRSSNARRKLRDGTDRRRGSPRPPVVENRSWPSGPASSRKRRPSIRSTFVPSAVIHAASVTTGFPTTPVISRLPPSNGATPAGPRVPGRTLRVSLPSSSEAGPVALLPRVTLRHSDSSHPRDHMPGSSPRPTLTLASPFNPAMRRSPPRITVREANGRLAFLLPLAAGSPPLLGCEGEPALPPANDAPVTRTDSAQARSSPIDPFDREPSRAPPSPGLGGPYPPPPNLPRAPHPQALFTPNGHLNAVP